MNAIVILLILTFCVPTAQAQRDYVVGVPAEMDEATAKAVLKQILMLTVEAAEDDRVVVLDAQNLEIKADFKIPRLNSYARGNPSARLNRLATEIALLQRFFGTVTQNRTGRANHIRYPQFLERAALCASASDVRILVFGSPFYQAEPAFTFGPDTYPGDGALLLKSAECPYGTADRMALLPQGASVQFCYLSESTFENASLERVSVQRFWNLFTARMGGTLATFAGDATLCAKRALAGAREPVSKEQIGDEPPGHTVRHITVTASPVPPAETSVAPAPELTALPTPSPAAPLEQNTPSAETIAAPTPEATPPTTPSAASPLEKNTPDEVVPTTQPGATLPGASSSAPVRSDLERGARAIENVLAEVPEPEKPGLCRIAAVWTSEGSDVDVDLWFRPKQAAAELSYQSTSTPEGRHLRDIRSALDRGSSERDWIEQWEVIELQEATLDELATSSSCWLNLYRGAGKPISGVVRFSDGEREVDVPFDFAGYLNGDCGKGITRREANACWIQIDLVRALAGLPTGATDFQR